MKTLRLGRFRSWAEARRFARRIANHTGRPVILVSRSRRRNPARWVTIRGRRVEIDERGRILRGLATGLEGVPLRRLPAYWKKRRRLERPQRCAVGRGIPLTYSGKGEAYSALIDANPRLFKLLEGVGGAGLVGQALRREQAAYKAGAKGATLFTGAEAGIDGIAEYLGKTPQQLGSLANAILELMPGVHLGRRPQWIDFGRIWTVLQEAVGAAFGDFKLQPPIPYILARAALEDADRCKGAIYDEVRALGAKYRPKVRRRRAALEAAPF